MEEPEMSVLGKVLVFTIRHDAHLSITRDVGGRWEVRVDYKVAGQPFAAVSINRDLESCCDDIVRQIANVENPNPEI